MKVAVLITASGPLLIERRMPRRSHLEHHISKPVLPAKAAPFPYLGLCVSCRSETLR